jgi:lycopene cyclase domain-containing protein
MSWLYLLTILVSTACLAAVDHRWRLCLFRHPARTLVVVAVGVAYFLTWDLVAIGLDIYRRGESRAMSGIEVTADLPLEEVFFVLFLGYLALVLHALLVLVLGRRPARLEVEPKELSR